MWQALLFVFFVIASIFLTRADFSDGEERVVKDGESEKNPVPVLANNNLSYNRGDVFSGNTYRVDSSLPVRDWNVLDPTIGAEAVLIQTLDENFPFIHYHTYKEWPTASVTKLLTAVLVLEDLGEGKKIKVTERAVSTEGKAGSLKSGEEYTARDLVKIMLITSSNDAATAFEDAFGGKDEFVKFINKKALSLGMTDSVFHDGSGLSELNVSTANDLFKLIVYIFKEHPDIFSWTRMPHFLVQPTNEPSNKTLYNIDPFVNDKDFLGGKTGTHDAAKENFAGIFSFGKYRIGVVILGSTNRAKELPFLFDWVREAYTSE